MKSRIIDALPPPQFVVQFPHPGREHNPGNVPRQPWNTGEHRRKFLQCNGRYVAEDGLLADGPLVFWGEWEAPSIVKEKRWVKQGSLPRFLHVPVWERPVTWGRRQNTDPWVFGDSFRFSNCRQLTRQRNRSALQKLTPGSMILFGSTIGDSFVVDTVFVVKDACPFSPGEPPETDEAFRVCTLEPIKKGYAPTDPLTLFRGATYEAPINGMYSFVPCRRADADDVRFARPSISLPGCVSPKRWRSAYGAKIPRFAADVREQWEKVRKQVLDAGCLLGLQFSTPQLDQHSTEDKRADNFGLSGHHDSRITRTGERTSRSSGRPLDTKPTCGGRDRREDRMRRQKPRPARRCY